MPEDENEVPEARKPRRWQRLGLKRIALGIAGATALGILGNAAWELATKPLGHWLINVVTLGSHKIRDGMYAHAVHDPSVAAGPNILMLVSLVAMSLSLLFLGLAPRSRRRSGAGLLLHDTLGAALHRTLLGGALLMTLAAIAEARFIMAAYEVKIWRAFHENMERCAPHLDDAKDRRLRAEFVAVKSKSDFDTVQAHIKALADGQCEVAGPD